nr:MAG TPA: hypothetical protein [Caudoviricetes sp.]
MFIGSLNQSLIISYKNRLYHYYISIIYAATVSIAYTLIVVEPYFNSLGC